LVRSVTEGEILAHSDVVTWQVVDPTATASGLTITWNDAGVAGCGQVTTALINETIDKVAVGLVADPLDPSIQCSGSLIGAVADVRLSAPLAARQLLEPVAFRSSGS
jgi:hypothetical protein